MFWFVCCQFYKSTKKNSFFKNNDALILFWQNNILNFAIKIVFDF